MSHVSVHSRSRGEENTCFADCFGFSANDPNARSCQWSRTRTKSSIKTKISQICKICKITASHLARLHILQYTKQACIIISVGCFHTLLVSGFCQITIFTANYVSSKRLVIAVVHIFHPFWRHCAYNVITNKLLLHVSYCLVRFNS